MEIKDVHAPKTICEAFTYPRKKDVNKELNILKRNSAEELSSLPMLNRKFACKFCLSLNKFHIHKCKDSKKD